MSKLKKFLTTNLSYKLIWLAVISAILLNSIGTRLELQGHNLIDNQFFRLLLSPLNDIRYGLYVTRKLFLVVIAFLVFVYWLKTQKGILQQIKKNVKYSFFIGLPLIFSRIFTFGFWFYNDDTRLFSYNLAAPLLPNYNPQRLWSAAVGFYPIALIFPMLHFFGTNYTLYNITGLFFYFLAGLAIFILVNNLQNNKLVSLTAALFFLTTPTYFQGRFLIGEVVNSPFILILVVLAIYLLLQKFIPGALIFAAAALEYGVSRTYFIALPLTLFAIPFVFARKKDLQTGKKGVIFFVCAIWLLSLMYLPAFAQAPGSHVPIQDMFNLNELIIIGDVLSSVTVSYALLYPLVHLLTFLLKGWIYLTAAVGYTVLGLFVVAAFIAYLKKRYLSLKLIVIGLSIIPLCAILAALKGVRVDGNVLKLVEYHNNSFLPMGATGYGFFPALGLVFIVIGLGLLIKKKVFLVLISLLILINTAASMVYDYIWMHSMYCLPQRIFNDQLKTILPKDNKMKYVYVPTKQRPLYQGVVTFVDIFQGDQNYYLFMDPDEFVAVLKKDNPPPDHIYFLITDGEPKYVVHDYSNKLRSTPYSKLLPLLQNLTKELTPNPTYFYPNKKEF